MLFPRDGGGERTEGGDRKRKREKEAFARLVRAAETPRGCMPPPPKPPQRVPMVPRLPPHEGLGYDGPSAAQGIVRPTAGIKFVFGGVVGGFSASD